MDHAAVEQKNLLIVSFYSCQIWAQQRKLYRLEKNFRSETSMPALDYKGTPSEYISIVRIIWDYL